MTFSPLEVDQILAIVIDYHKPYTMRRAYKIAVQRVQRSRGTVDYKFHQTDLRLHRRLLNHHEGKKQ